MIDQLLARERARDARALELRALLEAEQFDEHLTYDDRLLLSEALGVYLVEARGVL